MPDETGPPTVDESGAVTDRSDVATDGSGPSTAEESEPPTVEKSESPTVDEAVGRIRGRATAIRDRELETALSKLEASGELSPEDREAVADLADRLVEELVAVPESSLRETVADGSGENGEGGGDGGDLPVETALELFS